MASIADITTKLGMGIDVYHHFIKDEIKIGKKMFSPLREEREPSFTIFLNKKNGEYYFRDHGTGISGNHYKFVQELYSCDFKQAIEIIKTRVLNGNVEAYTRPSVREYEVLAKRESSIIFTPSYRDWEDRDRKLFSKALISIPTLEIFHVRPVSGYVLNKDDKSFSIFESKDNPIYFIHFPSGRVKIYRPLSPDPRYKWISNLKSDEDIFGLDLLPPRVRDLILISGNRDNMSFYENIGLPVIALSSESVNIPADVLHFLRQIAKNIWTLYDFDTQGIKKTKEFELEHGITGLNHIYKHYKVSDFCELTEKYPERVSEFSEHIEKILEIHENRNKCLV